MLGWSENELKTLQQDGRRRSRGTAVASCCCLRQRAVKVTGALLLASQMFRNVRHREELKECRWGADEAQSK